MPGVDFDSTFIGISASSISSTIWVIGGKHLSMVLEVTPGVGVEATVATMVLCTAVNKLLLREVEERFGSSPVRVFGTSSGTESPAGTTSSLVLDIVDTTLGSPVNNGIVLAIIKHSLLGNIGCWFNIHFLRNTTQPFLGLINGHGGEHVVCNPVGVLLVVHDVYFIVFLLEDFESELVLSSSSEGETLSFHMGSELLVHLSWSFLLLEETLDTEDRGSLGKVHHI